MKSWRMGGVGCVLLALICAGARAADVTLGTDSPPSATASGELRHEVNRVTSSGSTLTLAPGLTVTITETDAILLATLDGSQANLTISGSPDGSNTITSASTRTNPIFLSENNAGDGLTLENLTFQGITFSNTADIAGGGIVSAYSTAAAAIAAGVPVPALLGNMIALRFLGNTVDTTGAIFGGGLVGMYAEDGIAGLGMVTGTFSDNTITAGTVLNGGGVLGAYADNPVPPLDPAILGLIRNATFTNNTVSAGGSALSNEGYALGSVIGLSGLFKPMTLTDVTITNNSLTVANHNQEVTAGTVYIGTDRTGNNPNAADAHVHEVLVKGNTTISGNTIRYDGGEAVASSFHFGRGWDAVNGEMFYSRGHAALTLAPEKGKAVVLLDPVSVDMFDDNNNIVENGNPVFPRFAYTIAGDDVSSRIELGGTSRLDAGGGSTFTAASGTLYLRNDFSLTKESPSRAVAAGAVSGNGGALHVHLNNEQGILRLVLDLIGRDENTALFANPDSFTVTNGGHGKLIASVTGATFDPNAVPTVGKWLFTDKRGTVTGDDFNFALAADGKLEFLTEGDALYIAGSVGEPPETVRNSDNPNVLSAFQTGALQEAWLSAKADLAPLFLYEQDALFNSIAADPRTLTPEAYASQATTALSTANSIAQGVRSVTGAGVPGTFTRNAAPGDLAQNGGDGVTTASATALASRAAPGAAFRARPALMFHAGAFAGKATQDADAALSGHDSHFHGAAVAAAYRFTAFGGTLRAGASLALARDTTEYASLSAENKADILQAGLFLEANPIANLGLRLDATHTWLDNEMQRTTPIGRFGSDFAQQAFSLGLEAGYDFFFGGGGATRLTPYAGLRWQHLRQDAIAESTGAVAAFAANLPSVSLNAVSGFLGAELARTFRFAAGRSLTPSLRAAWRQEFTSAQTTGSARFGYNATSYSVQGLERPGGGMADLGASLRARVYETATRTVDLTFDATTSFGNNRKEHTFHAGIGISF